MNMVLKSSSVQLFLRIRALLKPLSTIPLSTVLKIRHIPINPYSSGDKRRARTIPTKKVTPCPRNASAALHTVPFIVLFFNDSSAILIHFEIRDPTGGNAPQCCCMWGHNSIHLCSRIKFLVFVI